MPHIIGDEQNELSKVETLSNMNKQEFNFKQNYVPLHILLLLAYQNIGK